MTANNTQQHRKSGRRDGLVAVICGAIVLGMAGLAFASVPLYRLYCQVTGYAGTVQRAEKASTSVLDRVIKVRFDANVAAGLPWTFEPAQSYVDVKVGENTLAFYKATNNSDQATTGTAVFNVAPDQVGTHFNKVQCFCFTEQHLGPGQTAELAVSFFIDPTFITDEETKNLQEVTLSYSFYPVAQPKKPEGHAEANGTGRGG
jgi:cytochrome c oxidase assembly protein subunit 11